MSTSLESVSKIARDAGAVIMSIYATVLTVRVKGDASPVTEADLQAEAVITAGLAAPSPDIPVVAEESVAVGRLPKVADRFWLVDPLDGTKEFVGRNGEFTVNIALVERGKPVLGVVLAPALGQQGRLFAGRVGEGAYMVHKVASMTTAGSSLKLCLVAAGEADLYPRLGRTMEWDIAAGHAVLEAAGGIVLQLDVGLPLTYGKPGFANPHFVASGLTPRSRPREQSIGPVPRER